MSMAISEAVRFRELERLVTEQQRRIVALEAALTARKPLAEINESRRADVRQLRTAIADVLAAHPEPDRLTAKHVGRALERAGFQRVPPERTLRRHLTAVRGHGRTSNGRKQIDLTPPQP